MSAHLELSIPLNGFVRILDPPEWRLVPLDLSIPLNGFRALTSALYLINNSTTSFNSIEWILVTWSF